MHTSSGLQVAVQPSEVIIDPLSCRAHLISACVGDQVLRVNKDQFIKLDPTKETNKCASSHAAYSTHACVFAGLEPCTFSSCTHNLAYATCMRQSKTKGVANPSEVAKFVEWSKRRIDRDYVRDHSLQAQEDWYDIMRENIAEFKESGKRRTLHAALDTLIEQCGSTRVSNTEIHIKKEVTFGMLGDKMPWPRVISAREASLRLLSGVLYGVVSRQVYDIAKETHMIKGLSPDDIIPLIAERMAGFLHHLCIDISSFDSSQRGAIWEIERHLFIRILGEENADIWCSIAQNNNYMKTGDHSLLALMPCARNSGEMTTSLTNTLLSKYLFQYAAERVGLRETDYDFFVEGDDNYSAFNGPSHLRNAILDVYCKLGFEATVESFGGMESTPTFCKINFTECDGSIVGFKRLDHALAKLFWLDANKCVPGSVKSNHYLIAKMHSCLH